MRNRIDKPRILCVLTLLLVPLTTTAVTVQANYTYDAINRMTSIQYTSGIQVQYTYDSAGNITNVVHSGGAGVVRTLTINRSGSGTVARNPLGNLVFSQPGVERVEYASGTIVILTAQPQSGESFIGWGGACTGTQTTCVVTMSLDHSVMASFTAPPVGNDFTVGGVVSGLTGSGLQLRLNSAPPYSVGAGAFTFPQTLGNGVSYTVTVATQPVGQTCSVVSGGSGTITGANVTNVMVTCSSTPIQNYTIGGTASGVTGQNVGLSLNGGGLHYLNADGAFTFPNTLPSGQSYQVTISATPAAKECSIANGTGTVTSQNVTNIIVNCVDAPVTGYLVGGRVAGLIASPVVLQLNGGLTRTVTANGLYDFNVFIPNGTSYNVQVLQQPADRQCIVTRGTGVIAGGDVSDVDVICVRPGLLFGSGFEDTDLVLPQPPQPLGNLNDTGIVRSGAATSGNGSGCESAHPARQDCHHGRDSLPESALIKMGGSALNNGARNGFDYTKISNGGSVLPANAALGSGAGDWGCTRDNVTGLMWQVVQIEGNFSWYDSNSPDGNPGRPNGGACAYPGNCDTEKYVQVVNDLKKFCGFTDWRLPTRNELLSIVDYGRTNPPVDPEYFPGTPVAEFWTVSPYATGADRSWEIYFSTGIAEPVPRTYSAGMYVRVVRGAQ